MELFAKIVFKGLTFKTSKGNMLPQEVYRLPLTGNNGYNLDETSKILLKSIRSASDESLVGEGSYVHPDDQLRLDVLTYIINQKQLEKKAMEDALVVATRNAKIDSLIAQKKDSQLADLSIEELEAMKAS